MLRALSADRGDTAALFRLYGRGVFSRCRRLLGDDEAAKDAVQEVFLRAHAAADRFRGDASPFTWLYSIATTYCLQQLRNRARRAKKLEEIVPMPAESGDAVARLDLIRLFETADEDALAMAFLRFVDGLTLEEVAEVAGLSRKTVAKRLEEFRAESAIMLGKEQP